jgi:hypothetical protein
MAVTYASSVNFRQYVRSPPDRPIHFQLVGKHSVQSVAIVFPVETTIGSAGGGSAQTWSAVGRIEIAAISPQLRNLRMIEEKVGVSLQSN